MNDNNIENPFFFKKESFPISYNFTEINLINEPEENDDFNRFYVKSKLHQTNKYITLPFYKLICLGVKIQTIVDL